MYQVNQGKQIFKIRSTVTVSFYTVGEIKSDWVKGQKEKEKYRDDVSGTNKEKTDI